MKTLSDKMDYANDYESGYPRKVFYKKDVKEFIKKLKHQLCGEFSSDPKFNERQINKLAGDALVAKEEQ